MSRKTYMIAGLAVVVALAFGASVAMGQNKSSGREGAFTGRVVDLHCFMTGVYPTNDRAKCTAECIKAGVPIALETREGILLVGRGMKGAATLFAPLAYQQVEVKGKLYTNKGLRYLDVTNAKKIVEDEDEDIDDEEDEDFDDEDEDRDEDESETL